MKNLIRVFIAGIVIMGTVSAMLPAPAKVVSTEKKKDIVCGTKYTTPLMAGKCYVAGKVNVYNDEDYVYVEYITENGWYLKETHLYFGNCNAIPLTKTGNPKVGNFPYKNVNGINQVYQFYKIPKSKASGCNCVLTHASVVKLDSKGKVKQQETAWGKGEPVTCKGNWAMKFKYCWQACDNVTNTDGCAYTESVWFDYYSDYLPESIEIGGKTYTKQEIIDIRNCNAPNTNHAKFIFIQVAVVKANSEFTSPTASVWNLVANAEGFLKTLPKLNPGSMPTNVDATAYTTAQSIKEWVERNACQIDE